MNLNRRHLATVALLGLVAVAGGLMFAGGAESGPAPAVSFTLLDGKKVDTAQLKGQVVLVNFWATSCTTCVGEMPNMVATYDKFHNRGYNMVAVAMEYDPPAYVANFAESRKLPFGVAIDNTGEIAQRFGEVRLTPTSVLIDKQGRIVKRYVGAPDFAELHTLVEKLLAEKA